MLTRNDNASLPHVAVCVDNARAYGRKVLQGIADYADTVGRWSLYVDPEATGSYSAGWLKNWRGDGILAYVESRATARRLRASGIPTVEVFGHDLDLKLPQVGNDDEAIGRLAAEHLLACRFKHFAFCGYQRERWSERRRAGFEWVITSKGLEVRHFHVSRSVLYRRFHDALNRSPHEEILRVQLERAKRLLDESNFTLERIAELGGFQHSEYLSVAFKRELGMTPGEYRRQMRQRL